MNLEKYKSALLTKKLNYMLVPVNNLGMNDEGIKEFNELYFYARNNIKNRFVRTPSGGISVARGNLRGQRWDVRHTNALVELIFTVPAGKVYRFQIGAGREKRDKNQISGRKAWATFKEICTKFGVDIEQFKISPEEGKKIKQEIPNPPIDVKEEVVNKTLVGCHHIDLNSSFMAGVARRFNNKALFEPINYIYENRKKDGETKEKFKAILTHTYGFFQCSLVKYQYSHLAKIALEFNNEFLAYLDKRLTETGRTVIAHNTDGIWYQGPVYHDAMEGIGLGQWKNDHKNCTLRFKSKGAYEYIEDGKYTPVYRGISSYERIKPREKWTWGDIYKGYELQYSFSYERGIYRDETKEY
mgnify:CR=1 FL=1